MTEKRRYTRKQKAEAVAEAEMTSAEAAAEKLGIPRTTILYWRDQPEFVEIRQKTREDAAEGWKAILHLAQAQIIATIHDFEPRDLSLLSGIATDKYQLLSGEATARSETKALSDGLDDHEKRQLRQALDGLLSEPATADAGSDASGAGSEVRE